MEEKEFTCITCVLLLFWKVLYFAIFPNESVTCATRFNFTPKNNNNNNNLAFFLFFSLFFHGGKQTKAQKSKRKWGNWIW